MILLMQHGKSFSKDEDATRGLTEQGKIDSAKVSEILKKKNIELKSILHSTKKRATQTAEIVWETLGAHFELREVSGLSPNDDVVAFTEQINDNNKLIVGHLPFLQKMLSYLVTNNINNSLVKFRNSCIICLKKEDNLENYQIDWIIMPDS